ncbi:hypothetical protein AAMO2058_001402100 [Amorphochlora amoebiformis]
MRWLLSRPPFLSLPLPPPTLTLFIISGRNFTASQNFFAQRLSRVRGGQGLRKLFGPGDVRGFAVGRLSQKRHLGQVFLRNMGIRDQIVTHADIHNTTDVVEVGCGMGVLTLPLAQRSKSLTIIESDCGFLSETLRRIKEEAGKAEVEGIHSDFTKCGFQSVSPERFTVVSNLPYQISTEFVQLVVSSRHRIDRCVVMLQRDFAERMAARPGSKIYGSLSIFAQFYLKVRPLMDVPRTAFKPIPKVESQVIEIIPRSKPLYDLDEDRFFRLVRGAFWGRRKTLAKCIREAPGLKDLEKQDPLNCPFFQTSPMVRGEALRISDFVTVYEQIFGIKATRNSNPED